jgi:molecular chaperone HscA
MKMRALREEQVEAQRLLLATQSAMDADGDLLSDVERADIDALMHAVRQADSAADHEAVKAAVSALANGTEQFAARRMDRSVRAALAGKKLDQLA